MATPNFFSQVLQYFKRLNQRARELPTTEPKSKKNSASSSSKPMNNNDGTTLQKISSAISVSENNVNPAGFTPKRKTHMSQPTVSSESPPYLLWETLGNITVEYRRTLALINKAKTFDIFKEKIATNSELEKNLPTFLENLRNRISSPDIKSLFKSLENFQKKHEAELLSKSEVMPDKLKQIQEELKEIVNIHDAALKESLNKSFKNSPANILDKSFEKFFGNSQLHSQVNSLNNLLENLLKDHQELSKKLAKNVEEELTKEKEKPEKLENSSKIDPKFWALSSAKYFLEQLKSSISYLSKGLSDIKTLYEIETAHAEKTNNLTIKTEANKGANENSDAMSPFSPGFSDCSGTTLLASPRQVMFAEVATYIPNKHEKNGSGSMHKSSDVSHIPQTEQIKENRGNPVNSAAGDTSVKKNEVEAAIHAAVNSGEVKVIFPKMEKVLRSITDSHTEAATASHNTNRGVVSVSSRANNGIQDGTSGKNFSQTKNKQRRAR